jgi:SPP1 family predicted phage head-tail adaptor
MTGPGALNRRLALEAPVETPDGAGGVTRGYETVATLWAEVTPTSARGDVVAASLGATVTHRIVIRPGPDVTTRHRLRDGDRVFVVRALREIRGRRFIEIFAEERTD